MNISVSYILMGNLVNQNIALDIGQGILKNLWLKGNLMKIFDTLIDIILPLVGILFFITGVIAFAKYIIFMW